MHGKCAVHGKRDLVEAFSESPNNAIECVVHGCDVLNKRGFTRPYVLSEHTLVNSADSMIVCSEHTGSSCTGLTVKYCKVSCEP